MDDDWEDAFDASTGDFEIRVPGSLANEDAAVVVGSWDGPPHSVLAASKEVPVLVLDLSLLMGGSYTDEHGQVAAIDHRTHPGLVAKLEQRIERNMKGLQQPGELAGVGTPVAGGLSCPNPNLNPNLNP